MRAKVFWLRILTVSRITRLRSVRWLPSLRAKEQKISISLTAYSLALRSVNVTSAFEPSPPLRQDCDEILSPSTGGISAAAAASAGGGDSTGVAAVLSPGSGLAPVAGGDVGSGAAAAASCSGSAVLLASSERYVHAPNPIIRAAVNQTNPDLGVPAAPCSGRPEESPPIPVSFASPPGPVTSMQCSPVFIVRPSRRRNDCLLHRAVKKPRGHYTARPSTRLPISRFRRFILPSIAEDGNGCV